MPRCPICNIQEHDTPHLFTCTKLYTPWRSWTYGQTPSKWFFCWTYGGTNCRHSLWVSWGSSLEIWEEGLTTTTMQATACTFRSIITSYVQLNSEQINHHSYTKLVLYRIHYHPFVTYRYMAPPVSSSSCVNSADGSEFVEEPYVTGTIVRFLEGQLG